LEKRLPEPAAGITAHSLVWDIW